MKNPEDIVRLSQYLSSRHPNIKFTYEEENNNCEFLDVNVLRDTNRLSTSIHRKHKPVYTNYKSVLPDTYVCKDLLSNLTVSRMKFSSFYHSLHEEVENLQNIFTKNGYKMKLIDRCVKKFLNKIFDPILNFFITCFGRIVNLIVIPVPSDKNLMAKDPKSIL